MGEFIGLGFLILFAFVICGAGIGEFLETRRLQKFRHEREMAETAARKTENDRP